MQPYRRIQTQGSQIYLTFDDGPCPDTTPLILQKLKQHNAKATFFVIGHAALQNKSIVRDLIRDGHSIGNHSIDHKYQHYFRNKVHLKNWILESQTLLTKEFGVDPVAFRSPAGVITPPLRQAIKELKLPWVHWNHRFFDTNVPISWTSRFRTFRGGDIILFHDRQKSFLRSGFVRSLDRLLASLRHKGFDFQPLSKEKFPNEC